MHDTRGYLPTLDGWRALAVTLVIVCHCANGAHLPPRWDALGTLAGAEGVSVFFAISGLLITWRLLLERGRTGRSSLRQFYFRRVCRILPAAYVYLAAVALIDRSWANLAPAAFFYSNYVSVPLWAVGHFWSLSLEEHFYLLWPVLLLWLRPRRAALVAAALCLTVLAWRGWEVARVGVQPWLPPELFWHRTDIRLDALLYGCLLAIALHSSLRTVLLRRLTLPLWVAIACVFLAAALGRLPSGSFNATVQAICLPLVLVGTLLHPAWRLSRLLETSPMRWLGRISYSLYLWQQLFLGMGRDHLLPLRLAAVVACATASYYLVERPAIRWGRRRSSPSVSSAAAAGVPVS